MEQKFDVEIYVDKKKIKTIYLVGGILFLISLACVIWAQMNWEDYSETVTTISGKVKQRGLAPTLFGWGIGFAIAIPIVYGAMWTTIDFKNPSLAANKEGIFINKEFFKKTFISWDQFSEISFSNGALNLKMKDPQSIVNQQKGMGKPFLKQTYVKDESPFSIDPEESEKHAELVEFIRSHCEQ